MLDSKSTMCYNKLTNKIKNKGELENEKRGTKKQI